MLSERYYSILYCYCKIIMDGWFVFSSIQKFMRNSCKQEFVVNRAGLSLIPLKMLRNFGEFFC